MHNYICNFIYCYASTFGNLLAGKQTKRNRYKTIVQDTRKSIHKLIHQPIRAIRYVVYTMYAQGTKGMILDIFVIKFGMYWLDPDNLLSNNVLCSVSNCGIHESRQLWATLVNHTLLNT